MLGQLFSRDKALWIAVLTLEVGTVFLRVLGHNGRSLKDAIGADSTLHHRAFSFGEEVRRYATEKNRESCIVFGMPGEAIRINAADYILAPEEITAMLTKLVHGLQPPVTSSDIMRQPL